MRHKQAKVVQQRIVVQKKSITARADTGPKPSVPIEFTGDELADCVYIQEEPEKISIAVDTLQLWCERMLDICAIDQAQYGADKKSKL